MIRYRSIVLTYIGILCFIENVLTDDLNLQNILFSGFSINNKTKDSCSYTEIAPKEDKGITRVLDGQKVLWEADGRMVCIGVIVITKNNYKEALMYIEFSRLRDYSVKYFSKEDGDFTENDKATFDEKLSKMSNSPSSSTEDLGYGSGDTSEDLIEEVYVNEDEYEENPENVVTEFENAEVFLNKKGSSLRKVPDYQCDRDDRECCNQKRVLDIMRPEGNKRVRFEYELNDGVPTMTITSKKNKRVTMVYEDEYKIWNGNGDEKLVLLSAHSFYGEYRLLELFYAKNKKNYNIFFNKIKNEWNQVNDEDFVNYYKKLKSQIKHIQDISLNVSDVKNSELFYEKYERNERFKATTYFPITGYHLTQVGDGNKLIWSSQNRRCIAAIVITENKLIRFLKLEILAGDETTFNKFYKKEGDKYVKIDENDFEQFINNEKPVSFEEAISVNKVSEPEPVRQTRLKETNTQTERHLEDEYEPEDINLDNFRIDYSTEQTSKETMDQFSGTDYDFDVYKPTELDLNDLAPHSVSNGEYRHVKYKSIFPQEGSVFVSLKVGNNAIWQGNISKYSDFVRVFYHENEPKLGFMRLNENGNEYDRYFVEDSGLWKFVTDENFKLVFDLYAEYEASKRPTQESTRGIQTEMTIEVLEDSGDNKTEEHGKSHGPYKGRQPNTKEENSPLAFFVFDINDEDQALHS